MADKTITVTVATGSLYIIGGTGNVYFFDGAQPVDQNLDWVTGGVLKLEQSNSSNDNHPLYVTTSSSTNLSTGQAAIQTSNISYYLDGVVSQATYYNTVSFNAATTRYVEFTASATQSYYSCWIHGIGMGGFFDLTADTWGALNWGQGEWAQQGDSTVSLTGFNLTTALNPVVTVTVTPGWGTENWGENGWGDVTGAIETLPTFTTLSMGLGSLTTGVETPVVITDSFNLTGAVGTIDPKFDFNLTLTNTLLASLARGTLDVNDGSDQDVGLESFSLSTSVGAIAPSDVVGLEMADALSTQVGNLIDETATFVTLPTLTAMSTAVGAIEVADTQVGITASFNLTSAVGSIVPVNNTGVQLTGLELTVVLDATELTTTGYRNVDMTVNSNYTDVKHVNQA
tara:strand:+ start:1266 stop:2462 length:1197 start_codon:yes stop_codon:yes gene_type:complete